MNVLDLFSGIGGFSLGLERAGMRTVAFCERDEFCRAVLRKHWPRVPCFDDIHAIDADGLDRIGPVDLVCGGFPCQPFSHAGKQRAQADDRYLWPAMREVIARARPTWVIGENVTGIIPLALDDVLFDLEGLGYAARAFVIPAVAVDARHRRDRVWIIARAADCDGESALPVDAEMAELRSFGADSYCDKHEGRTPEDERETSAQLPRAHADSSGLERRHDTGVPERAAERPAGSGGASAADPSSCGRPERQPQSGGRGDGNGEDERPGLAIRCRWLPEPDVGRVADGVPRRVDRLRALGNAVVPQVVEEIGRAIMRAEGLA